MVFAYLGYASVILQECSSTLNIGIQYFLVDSIQNGFIMFCALSEAKRMAINVNKPRQQKAEKRLRRLQRKASRKYDRNKGGSRFVKTSNIVKVEKQIRLLHGRLTNIRTHHIHQATDRV